MTDLGHTVGDARKKLADEITPMERCHRCDGENPSWAAESPLWNKVMRGNDIDGDPLFGDMVCMECFKALATEAGVEGRWLLTIEPLPEDLVYKTPSGRVWDAEQWRWVDATEPMTGDELDRLPNLMPFMTTAQTRETVETLVSRVREAEVQLEASRAGAVNEILFWRDLKIKTQAERDELSEQVRILNSPPAHLYRRFRAERDVARKALEQSQADAWDEGYDAGRGDEAHIARGLSTDPGADEVPHSNPYREGDSA